MSLLGKKYRQASFRGAKFFVAASDFETGRRTADHEFPQRDVPHSEDLGRRALEFTIEGYVIGDKYRADRDSLITACEKEGPGALVHPYLGTKKVVCKACRVRESSSEGRIARFSLTFREAGEPATAPSSSIAQSQSLLDRISSTIDAVNAEFASGFGVLDAASYVADEAQAKIDQLTDIVSKATYGIRAQTEALAELTSKIRQIKASAITLIRTPAMLAAKLGEVIRLLGKVTGLGGDATVRKALTGFLTYGSTFPVVPRTTSNRIVQANNQAALVSFIRRTAIAELANQVPDTTFTSREDARTQRDTLLDAIDAEVETTPDDTTLVVNDDVFSAFQGLRAALVQTMPPATEDLPDLVDFTPARTLPSLRIAYDLYGSLDLEADIVARNFVAHPGFLQGGQTLKVLRSP